MSIARPSTWCGVRVGSRRSPVVCILPAILAAFCAPVAAIGSAQEPGIGELRGRIMTESRSALVSVELYLKLPSDDEGTGPSGAGETVVSQLQDRQQEAVAREQKAIEFMGVIISPRDVLVPDTGVDPRRIDRWEVVDGAGKRTAARRAALLLDAPALVLQPADESASWSAPAFADAAVDSSSALVLVTPQLIQTEWVLNLSSIRTVTRWEPASGAGRSGDPFWVVGSLQSSVPGADALLGGGPRAAAAGLIFTPAGQLLGAALADRIYADRNTPPWRGEDLRTAARLSDADWQQIEQRTREQSRPTLYPVRIEYRRPKGGAQAFPDSELLGWAVSKHTLLIPHAVPRTVAAQIGRISVQRADREVEAEFIGQFREFDAFMIALDSSSDPLPAHAELDRAGSMAAYRPHIAMTLNRKYGDTELRIDYTRQLGTIRAFGNRLQPQLIPPPSLGSLLWDLEGRPIGVFARRRRPMEELEPYEQAQSNQPRSTQQTGNAELFTIGEWASAVRDPASFFDPHVVRRDEQEQDRRVWLGIEFNPLTRDLAESLGCRKASKDGAVGLMINQIYAGSPAAAADLQVQDVLLSVEVPGRARPIELIPPRGGRGGMPDFAPMRRGEGEFNPGAGRAPWPNRNNYLTTLLAIIGADTQVRLKYWRAGSVHETTIAIAQAPPDQDSAAQFKDESIGLTVKEITYEVRSALRMDPDDPGVVVAKVESGTAAGRARINPFEIIQAADGEPIRSPAAFGDLLKRAVAEKKEQIRLTVVDRGRSRFADLKLSP